MTQADRNRIEDQYRSEVAKLNAKPAQTSAHKPAFKVTRISDNVIRRRRINH